MIPRVKLTYTDDDVLGRIQSNTGEVLSQIKRQNPILDGSYVKGVALSTSDTRVEHLLKRPFQGFIVTKINSASIVYESPTQNLIPDKVIILQASAAATVDLYIF